MPNLTDEIKTFIVKGLACYDTPSQVAEAVKANFDVEITRQHVYAYDPKASQHMAPRWRDLHAATRAALLRETSEIGIAHRAVRLLRLDRLASRSERNNVLTALKCIEMAAKECGGMYENRKPIVLQQPIAPPPALPEPPAPQPVAARPARRRPPAPRPSAPPPPVIQQPSAPEPQTPSPQRRSPLPELPLPVMPQPAVPVPSAPQPLAVLAQPAQPATAPVSPPLSRVDRYLAYVRDRHARDRLVREGAVAAPAPLDGGRIST